MCMQPYVSSMPSEEYHLERARAHQKWARNHLFFTGISLLTFVGILWAWIPGIKWLQHRSKARTEQRRADEAASGEATATV